tara:strand:- start:533 stop:1384 length:852 start_codon:yes stop_codon:yes gene_type:complete
MNIFQSEFFLKSKFHWNFIKEIEYLKSWELLAKQYKNRDKNAYLTKKIPKIIHQVWIGPKKMPLKYKNWMHSWRELNPEYEYRFWTDKEINKLNMINKKKYEISQNVGTKSDIARYEILNNFGGIYVDTDFECLKKIPEFLHYYDFVSSIIFDTKPCIANGFIMSQKKSKFLEEIISKLNLSQNKNIINDTISNSGPGLLTREYFNLKQSIRKRSLILPTDFFYPYPNFLLNNKFNKKEMIEKNSIAIHHWEMSWMKGNLLKRLLKKVFFIFKKLRFNIINKI